MRVLFVTGEFAPMQGGVGDYTREIARALVNCAIEAHVLTTDPGGAELETRDGLVIHRLVRRWDWGAIGILRRLIKQTRPDIVHLQYQTAAFGMHPAINLSPRLLALRSPGARLSFVTTFHDLKLPYLFPKAGPVREWITFELARSSAAVIATNADDNARLRVVAGERVRLIPIGSNISPEPPAAYDRARWRIQLGVAPSELLLSYFGFLNASKGAETLIRALVALPQARLLMVGGQVGASDPTNAAYLQSILALIDELGLAARVLWIGFTASEEVSANLLASDVCVLPYRDGASFRRGSLMAALAHQLPIVTTHPPVETAQPEGRPRLIDGENVLLVPPDDPSALAAAVAKLAVSPELRARLSAGARELSNSFSWDRIAQQHLALYDNLLQN